MVLSDKIEAAAKETIPLVLDGLKERLGRSGARYYKFAYQCDMVLDIITYDRETNTFSVEYSVGIGEPALSWIDNTGYYDETKKKTLTLTGELFGLYAASK